ncbi:MAG TPA: lysylphosphatidylglycerol synthase transmembrane domain-containing protein [bacterium]|nr:lysylphosphatidylglycerol synthase transmembrane domain-containing protein [bacterium]
MKNKNTLKTIVKIIISGSLIYYLFTKKVNISEVATNFKLLDWRYVVLMALIIIIHYTISSFRWKSLLIHERSNEVSRLYLLKLYFEGAFFNNFMPTSIGGDAYKIVKLGRKIKDPATGFSSVFTERFTGILMLFLIGLLSLSKQLGWGVLVLIIWLISGFYIGMYVLKILSKKISFVRRIYDALMVYKDYPKVLFFAMFTSLIIQLLSIFTQYLAFRAVGIKLPVFYSLMAFPIITLAGFFIPSINGLGVQDMMYVSMFSFVGVSQGIAATVSITYHIVRMGVSLIGGILYALDRES